MTGNELKYISEAHIQGHLAGDGSFTRLCHDWLEGQTGCKKALLTHSCTAALEMAAILANIQPGDEIIMPSYTFVSTANAFVLRGGVPVFVDIRPDTFNIDENKIEAAITSRTKAIVPVHYAGVACDMDTIMSIANKHGLLVIEDAAQAIMSTYKGRHLGSIGHMGCFSFHETKNIISGEGGALLVNDTELVERAEIVREKGTNRSQFFRGYVDKYTWVDIGSSYLPGEIIGAFLWAQIEQAESITRRRLSIWDKYHKGFEEIEKKGLIRKPVIPVHCKHNAHMYYIVLTDLNIRKRFIADLNSKNIQSVFHYIPLHTSPAGKRFCRDVPNLPITDDVSDRLTRLPLWCGLEGHQDRIIDAVNQVLVR
jgi:dTDP-4-amino-4,6-dideoxygalactose transaminase